MAADIIYIESTQTNPYRNLALEEALLLNVKKGQCILYLWQNQNTVVIGRNQNAWKECLAEKLSEDGGHLARRLSGGGAVYHDLGNLNFTFLAGKEDYDLAKQLQVITEAVQSLGIPARISGRNDILADGRKFSGNAYYEQGDRCYHHGTLMVDVKMDELSKYLTVSKEKLQSKGVDSVKSRVVNLREFSAGLTVEQLKLSLKSAFRKVYRSEVQIWKPQDLDQKELVRSEERFASWEWIFGKRLRFSYELNHRFDWGCMTLQMEVKNGRIKEAAVYSDSMKPDLMLLLPHILKGLRYRKEEVITALESYHIPDPQERSMIRDLSLWIAGVEF